MKIRTIIQLLTAVVTVGLLSEQSALRAQETQTSWTSLPEIDSFTSPAIAEHSDNQAYIAAVAFDGLVAYTSTDTPGTWLPWQILGPAPCSPTPCPNQAFYANPQTAPVLVEDNNTLYLFARGNDNNLHVIQKRGDTDWESTWRQITSDGRVQGRISVAFRRSPNSAAPEIHVLHVSGNDTVEFREFNASWTPVGQPRQWCNAMEGTLATDGTTYLCAVIRMKRELVVEVKSGSWPFEPVARRVAQGSQGTTFDLSSVVHYAGAFHVIHAERSGPFGGSSARHALVHTRVRPGHPDDGFQRTVAEYTPQNGKHPLSELIVYRNKLVAGFTDPGGWIRYSRWDNADADLPWIPAGGDIVAQGRGKSRPALARFNSGLPSDTNFPDTDEDPFVRSAGNEFGNDLLAAVTQASGEIQFINFSRAFFKQYMNQIGINTSYLLDDAPPTAVSFKDRLYLFLMARGRNVWYKSSTDSQTWDSSWVNLGGDFTATAYPFHPSAVVFDSKLYLFISHWDGGKIYMKQTSDGSNWSSNWVPPNIANGTLGTVQVVGSPTSVVFNNALHLFAMLKDGPQKTIITTTTQNGVTWSAWRALPAFPKSRLEPISSIGSVQVFNGRMSLFVRGLDKVSVPPGQSGLKDTVWSLESASDGSWNNATWTDLQFLTPSDPAAVVQGNTLNLFVRDQWDAIWFNRATTAGWVGWARLPGGSGFTPNGPGPVVHQGKLHVFVRDMQYQIARNETSDGVNWLPSWIPNTPGNAADLFGPFTEVENLPVFTEAGYACWALPHWMLGHLLMDYVAAQPPLELESGERDMLIRFGSHVSGVLGAAYDVNHYMFWVNFTKGAFISQGDHFNYRKTYSAGVWDELGHTLANALTIQDAGSPPLSYSNLEPRITSQAIQDAITIFGDPCQGCGTSSGRPRGFITSNDSHSRQHNWMYPLIHYFSNGDQLRQWIRDDQLNGPNETAKTLLKKKYDWMKSHIFKGLEFGANNKPRNNWNDHCTEATVIREGVYRGSTRTATSDGYAMLGNSAGSPDVWFSYEAACSGFLALNTCGSSFDTVLSVHGACPGSVANQIQANDDCAGAGCGGINSCLSVPIVQGRTYWIRVAGSSGARGDFQLSVSSDCPRVFPFGVIPDRFDTGETRNDSQATAVLLPGNLRESRIVPGATINHLNHDSAHDIDFFTVQLPDAMNECCAEPVGPDTLQGQFRIMVHPDIFTPFEMTIYGTNGSIIKTGSGSSLSLDCPHDFFPEGRVTFSVRDPNCRNTFDVSLWYNRCETLHYKPWYVEYDPPLFNWTIPEFPDWLPLTYPLDPETLERYQAGELDPPYPFELLRFDRPQSGPYNVGAFLPQGGDLSLELLDQNGELIGVGSWREATPIQLPKPVSEDGGTGGDANTSASIPFPSPAPGPASLPIPIPSPFLYLTVPNLPSGTYYLRIQSASIGVAYMLKSFPLAEIVNINCGYEDDLIDGLGRVWLPDGPFLQPGASPSATFSTTGLVDATLLSDPLVPQEMLLSERWADGDLLYGIPVPAGRYHVTLYFSETYAPAVGPLLGGTGCFECDRLFDLEIEGQSFPRYSPADAAVGGIQDGIGATFTGTELTFDVRVDDGTLNIGLFDLGPGSPPQNVALKGITVRGPSRKLSWLEIAGAEDRIVLSWPSYLGATLQSSPHASGPYNTEQGTVVQDGLYHVLNLMPSAGDQRFYRLQLPQ